MKSKLFVLILLMLSFTMFGCRKERLGEVTFWQASGSGYGITVVELNGVSSNITSEYNTAPNCGASGCAVFKGLPIGKHSYYATDGNSVWSGQVDIFEGCLTLELF
jgi:hypothetical protein